MEASMKNFIIKAASLALCIAMLFTLGVSVFAENIDEAWDIGENYVFYGTYISVGENSYELSQLYDYTLFAFMPDETGKYTFSVDGGEVGIVSYNAMWVSIQPSESTVTAEPVSWECTGVGQEIWIAVKADGAEAVINVEASESERVVIEKVEYVNKTTPEAFVFPGDVSLLQSVNVRNTKIDVPVLGEDGYYHLNSADGYIIYVNLNDDQMSLSAAASYGQLKGSVYNEDGELIAIDDYNVAFNEYNACADPASFLYPLTDDLILMLKEVGANQNWYGSGGWLGLSKDDAWMFCCYYTEEVFEKEPVKGDIDGNGIVNGIDSNYLMRIVAGILNIDKGSAAEKAADVNGDGTINAIDANMLKRILAGL